MSFFEFLAFLNEGHSQLKGLVKASDVRRVKAIILDVVGGDFNVRDRLQGYGILVECLSILNYPCPDDLPRHEFDRIQERACHDLLTETYQLQGGRHHD